MEFSEFCPRSAPPTLPLEEVSATELVNCHLHEGVFRDAEGRIFITGDQLERAAPGLAGSLRGHDYRGVLFDADYVGEYLEGHAKVPFAWIEHGLVEVNILKQEFAVKKRMINFFVGGGTIFEPKDYCQLASDLPRFDCPRMATLFRDSDLEEFLDDILGDMPRQRKLKKGFSRKEIPTAQQVALYNRDQ